MNKVKFSALEKITIVVNVFLGLSGAVSLLYLFVPKFQEKVGNWLFPFFDKITIVQWWIILGIVTFLLIIFNIVIIWYQKKSEISNLPHIRLAKCGVDNVLPKVNWYGANSFIARNLNHERSLLYIDIANSPKTKDKDKSKAIGVSVQIEYYDGDDGRYLYKSYLGRWMGTPERELGKNRSFIDIPSSGISERLGVAYMDYKSSTLYLLDSDQTDLSSEGIMVNPPHLSIPGNYVVVATVLGDNLWDIPPMVFELVIIKNETPRFYTKANGEKWLAEAKKSNKSIWKK
jgi:hypothetical protein